MHQPTILAPEQQHPTLSMEQFQAAFMNMDYDEMMDNKQYLPQVTLAELKATDKSRNWKAGDLLFGDLTNGDQHYHFLIIK